ncbi:hypothetical protein LEP1GSC125_2195 [Leptospira mayottensis 200901122]|uniref:Uncharacterized protein n=1 Tax=Leptospira mayottensis 200901122 TaxID=1193010 RepID=A0AA87MR78_9LEPT|nr:hypothetical protein LEP1GSC125_2195 [Leptospira mayottensis 200901122]
MGCRNYHILEVCIQGFTANHINTIGGNQSGLERAHDKALGQTTIL